MTTALPVLYSFRRCPYAMRARLAVAVAGRACLVREVVLADKPAALLAASPKGTVPVWVTPAGRVIDQSLDIMCHVLAQADAPAWRPPAPDDPAHAWVARCDGDFKFHLDRYKYASRHAGVDALAHRAAAAAFAAELDSLLRAAAFLAGPAQGWADLAVAPFIRQFGLAQPEWFDAQPWPALQAWLAAFADSALLARVMKKYPPWREGEPGVPFPDA